MRVQSTQIVNSDPLAQGLTLAVPFQANLMCIASGTLSGSFVTPPISVLHAEHWSGTAVTAGVKGIGTWQISNDASGNNEFATISVRNWVDYPNLEQQFKQPSDQATWNLQNQAYRWVRFKWTHQLGTGSIDVYLTAKG